MMSSTKSTNCVILGPTGCSSAKITAQCGVFIYDNGPGYGGNGTQRIVRDGKIGYINSRTGKIIVEPQYKCAEPFKKGIAEVSYNCTIGERDSEGHWSWDGGNWFYIDKKGRRLKQKDFN